MIAFGANWLTPLFNVETPTWSCVCCADSCCFSAWRSSRSVLVCSIIVWISVNAWEILLICGKLIVVVELPPGAAACAPKVRKVSPAADKSDFESSIFSFKVCMPVSTLFCWATSAGDGLLTLAFNWFIPDCNCFMPSDNCDNWDSVGKLFDNCPNPACNLREPSLSCASPSVKDCWFTANCLTPPTYVCVPDCNRPNPSCKVDAPLAAVSSPMPSLSKFSKIPLAYAWVICSDTEDLTLAAAWLLTSEPM